MSARCIPGIYTTHTCPSTHTHRDYLYQLLSLVRRANNHCFASHRKTHAPLSGASTDLLRSFAIGYSNYRDLFYIYRRVVVGKKKPIGPTGKEIQLFGFGGEFCPMTAPLTPLMCMHPKGGLPASRTRPLFLWRLL